jgi:hypothetical protein
MLISEFVEKYISEKSFSIKNVLSELIEIIEARSINNLMEELNDFCFCLQSLIYIRLKIDFPMFWNKPALFKFQDRLDKWQIIFKDHNLKFSKEYWKFGSNYNKSYKVSLALKLANQDQFEKKSHIESP